MMPYSLKFLQTEIFLMTYANNIDPDHPACLQSGQGLCFLLLECLREMDTRGEFSVIFTRKTAFVTSCLLSCTSGPSCFKLNEVVSYLDVKLSILKYGKYSYGHDQCCHRQH